MMRTAAYMLCLRTPPEQSCLLLIRSHWGGSSSHFTFLSLCAAAGLLGLLFLWVSAITSSSWITLQQKAMQPQFFFFFHPLSTHLLRVFFFSFASFILVGIEFQKLPDEQEKSINYLEQGLVWVILICVMLATLAEVWLPLHLFCSINPCLISS